MEALTALFPTFHGVYLDSAATTLRPLPVITAVTDALHAEYGSAGRGISRATARADADYTAARAVVADFFSAPPSQTIFTRSATDSLNMAAALIAPHIKQGDLIIVSALEHHANFLPWQHLAKQKNARLTVLPPTWNKDAYLALLTEKPAIVALSGCSNVLGLPTPADDFLRLAKESGAITILDGAQEAAHGTLRFDPAIHDFIAIAPHKMYGIIGLGVLLMADRWLTSDPPLLGGGIVERVTETDVTFLPSPARFEAGTPNRVGAIALATAITTILRHPQYAASLALQKKLASGLRSSLSFLPGITVLGGQSTDTTLLSFYHASIHAHDLGEYLDTAGITVRVGKHCAEPLHDALGIPGSVRFSLGVYNAEDDCARALSAVAKAITFFTR